MTRICRKRNDERAASGPRHAADAAPRAAGHTGPQGAARPTVARQQAGPRLLGRCADTATSVLYTQTLAYRNRFFTKSAGFLPRTRSVFAEIGQVPAKYWELFLAVQSQPPQSAQSLPGTGASSPMRAPPSAGSIASATFSISAHSMRLRNSLQPYS